VTVALPRGLAPLRHRDFRLLAGGQLASNLGDALYAVALPWYVLSAHGGALLLGTVLAVYGVTRAIALALGGAASDRWRPWSMMMSADLVRLVAVGALAVVAAVGRPQLALLAPIAVVLGVGDGLFLPGSFSIVPALLPGEDLQAGNALSSGGTQLALLVGPAIGGAIVALFGSTPAFAIDAASFLISALTLARIRNARRVPVDALAAETDEEAPRLRSLLSTHRVMWVIFGITVAANLGSGGMSEVALPALAHGPFGSGAAGYGALIAAFSAGALIGTVLVARASAPRRPAIVASVLFGAESLFMAATPYLGGAVPAAAMLFCFGALNGFANVVTITALQRWAPPAALGRVMSFILFGSFGSFPLSVLLGGLVVHSLGPAIFFPLGAATVFITVVGAMFSSQWREFGATSIAA
jgi:predicted MFS family arabinose efflux permease